MIIGEEWPGNTRECVRNPPLYFLANHGQGRSARREAKIEFSDFRMGCFSVISATDLSLEGTIYGDYKSGLERLLGLLSREATDGNFERTMTKLS